MKRIGIDQPIVEMFSNDPRLTDLTALGPADRLRTAAAPPALTRAAAYPSVVARARWIHSPAVDAVLGAVLGAVRLRRPRQPRATAPRIGARPDGAPSPFRSPTSPSRCRSSTATPRNGPPGGGSTPGARSCSWSPLSVGLAVSVAVVAVVAGLWNAEHTLMQRYGITRIYGRKAGETEPRRPAWRRLMLVSWLRARGRVGGGRSPAPRRQVRRLPLGEVNAEGLRILADLRTRAAGCCCPSSSPAAVVSTAMVGREPSGIGGERAAATRPSSCTSASTAALFGVILVDPVAGFVGYVGAHAVEYFVIVHRSLGDRWAAPGSGGADRRDDASAGRPPPVPRRLRRRASSPLVGGLRWYGNHRLYLIAVLSSAACTSSTTASSGSSAARRWPPAWSPPRPPQPVLGAVASTIPT